MNKDKLSIIVSIIVLCALIVTFAILGNKENEKPIEKDPTIVDNIDETETKEPFELLENFIYINDQYYYISNIDINNNTQVIGEEIGKIEFSTSSRKNKPGVLDNIKNGTSPFLEIGTPIYKIIGDKTNSLIACLVGDKMSVYTLRDVEIPKFNSKIFIHKFTFEEVVELSGKKDGLTWDELISKYDLKFENDDKHIFTGVISGNFMLMICGNKNDNNSIEIYLKNVYTNKVYDIFENNVDEIFGVDSIETRVANFTIEEIEDDKNLKLKLINDCYRLTTGEIYNARFFDDGPTTSGLNIGSNVNVEFAIRMVEEPVIYIKTINVVQ